jgi:multiple sugar transport system substrate-binding protein
MRSMRLSLALAAISAVVLTACGASNNAGGAASGTIRFSGWTSTPAEDKLLTDEIAAFQVKYPNIKVTYEPVPKDFRTKLKAQLASGTEPDAFYVELGDAAGFMQKHVLLDLRNEMSKTGTSASEFSGQVLSAFKQGDAIYGIPKDSNTLALFYNKDMFTAAGVALPTKDWTWQDLTDAAKKLTKPGQWGLITNPDAARWAPIVYQNGGQVLNKDNTKSMLLDPATVEATKYYLSFKQNGSGTYSGALGAGIDWPGAAFAKGKAAMVMEGGWLIPFMKDYPAIQWSATELPKGKNRGNLVFTVGYSISAHSKNPDAAWTLLNYLTSVDNQKTVLHSGFALPTRTALASDPYFASHPAESAIFAANSYAKPFSWGINSGKVADAIGAALERMLLGKQSVDDALKQADKEVTDALAS